MKLKKHIMKISPKTIAKLILSLIIISSLLIIIFTSHTDPPTAYENQNILNIFGDKFTLPVNLTGTFNTTLLVSIFSATALLSFVYIWASKLLGSFWALLPTGMTAFSPELLSYGSSFWPNIISSLVILIFAYVLTELLINIDALIKRREYLKPIIYASTLIILIGAYLYYNDLGAPQLLLQRDSWINLLSDYIFKESNFTLILILVASLFALKNIIKNILRPVKAFKNYQAINETEIIIMVFVIIYSSFVIVQNNENSIVNILAISPLIYFLTSSGIKNLVKNLRIPSRKRSD